MKRTLPWLALLPLLLFAAPARADDRTDGPEGSEIGKGGYTSASGAGHLGLELHWGAAIQQRSTADYSSDTPLFLGGAVSYWFWDAFAWDLTGNYQFANQRYSLMMGPRFRTALWPITFVFGLHAGGMMLTVPDRVLPNVTSKEVYFGLSPTGGLELATSRSFILGIYYAVDIPLGIEGVSQRVFLDIGWRF